MIFIYESGHQECKAMDSMIRGLNHRGERPIDCLISIKEIHAMFSSIGVDAAVQHFYSTIYRSIQAPKPGRSYNES